LIGAEEEEDSFVMDPPIWTGAEGSVCLDGLLAYIRVDGNICPHVMSAWTGAEGNVCLDGLPAWTGAEGSICGLSTLTGAEETSSLPICQFGQGQKEVFALTVWPGLSQKEASALTVC